LRWRRPGRLPAGWRLRWPARLRSAVRPAELLPSPDWLWRPGWRLPAGQLWQDSRLLISCIHRS
ncbi:hypothetical protein DENSPDRAFT_825555, partial [Dentipellis sp. KUC8613]